MTFNPADFSGPAHRFGVDLWTPGQLLKRLKGKPFRPRAPPAFLCALAPNGGRNDDISEKLRQEMQMVDPGEGAEGSGVRDDDHRFFPASKFSTASTSALTSSGVCVK